MNATLKAFGGVQVTIVEEYTGSHGKKWTRARSKNGNRIIAPSHLFQKHPDGQVTVNPADFAPSLVKSIDSLQKKFHRA